MKIAIIGTGAYSSAIAEQIYKNNKNIIMWTESEERYKEYLKNGRITGTINSITFSFLFDKSIDFFFIIL